LPKAIGEVGGLLDQVTNEPWMQFTLDAITPNPGCTTGYANPPSLGQFVVLTLTINVLAPSPDGNIFYVSSSDFHVIGPNGVRDNTNDTQEAFSCLDAAEMLPSEPLTVGTYIGKIVLDTPHLTGQVIWTPPALGGSEGWLWEF